MTVRCFVAGAVALVLLTFTANGLRADNWPEWRGPHNNGVCDEANLPAKFGKSDHFVWRLPLPGQAAATPVVWDNHIYLTSPDGAELLLICVGTDGHELWRRTVGHGNASIRVDEGNACSPSPITDGKHVWTLMGSGDLACYDANGKETWKLDLQAKWGKFKYGYGLSSTPVLDGDRLYLQIIHGDRQAFTQEAIVAALDKTTGKEVWKQTRTSDGYGENEQSYASPVIFDDGKNRLLLTHGADYIVAHRLDTGNEVWRCGGMNPRSHYNPTLRLVASPAVEGGLIIVPTAKRGPVIALRGDGTGNITDSKEYQIWKRARGTPDVPSPLIHNGIVYLGGENGDVTALDAHDGAELYHAQTVRVRHRASPVFADGKVYFTSRDGQISVIQAGREFKMLAKNELGEQISASPAISNGRIYLRTFEALWAVGSSQNPKHE